MALVAGLSLAATWSGLAIRRPGGSDSAALTGGERLLAPGWGRGTAILGLLILPWLADLAFARMARYDWASVVERLIVLGEGVLAFGLALRVTAGIRERPSTTLALVLPPVVVLAACLGLPRAASMLASWSGNRGLESTVVLERFAGAEPAFRFMSDALAEHAGFDGEYYRFLQLHAEGRGRRRSRFLMLICRCQVPRRPDGLPTSSCS